MQQSMQSQKEVSDSIRRKDKGGEMFGASFPFFLYQQI